MTSINLPVHSEKLAQARTRLETIQRLAGIGFWELYTSTGQLLWTDETFRIMGIDPRNFEEHVNTYLDLVYKDDQEHVFRALDSIREGKAPPDLVHRVTRPNGEIRTVYLRCMAVMDRDGGWHVTGTLQDITEKKNKDEALQQLADRLTATMESITDGLIAVDNNWRITYLNKAAEDLLQRPRTELVGNILWDECMTLIGTEFEDQYRHAMKHRSPVSFEAVYQRLNICLGVRVYSSKEGLTIYFSDVTDKKKAEEALRESEERFKIIARVTTDIVYEWNVKADTIWRNENIRSAFNIDTIERGIRSWADLIHPDDKNSVLDGIKAFLASAEDYWTGEYRLLRNNGSYAYVLDRAFVLRDGEGEAIRMIGALLDVTERKQADARIRRQARLLDEAKDAIFVRGLDSRVQFWNKGAERLYGWNASEATGQSVETFLYNGSLEFEEANRILRIKGEWAGELVSQNKNGNMIIVESHWTLVRDEDTDLVSILAINTDITERRKAEESLQRYAAQHRALSQKLLNVQEAERHNISRELHDQIGQTLTALKLALQRMRGPSENAGIAPELDDCIHLAAEMLEQIRNLSLDLRPPLLDEVGLVRALDAYINIYARRSSLVAKFYADELPDKLNAETETACFRIVQEALTNVVRHARASHVTVELQLRESNLILRIEDNGIGFEVDAARRRAMSGRSIGLLSMAERAALVGGGWNIISSPGAGTIISAKFPAARSPGAADLHRSRS